MAKVGNFFDDRIDPMVMSGERFTIGWSDVSD